jgi:hypothetical protein
VSGRQLLARILASFGYEVFNSRKYYSQDGLRTVHDPRFLRADPAFSGAYARGVEASAGHDPQFAWRVHGALWAAATALRNSSSGDFVECGVNAGFMSSAILRHLDWNRNPASAGRRYFLIDTFAGPVLEQFSEAEVQAGRRAIAEQNLTTGAYVTTIDRVRANFAEWERVHIAAGVIPEVLADVPVGNVAFLHVDLNCALPEIAALEHFWPRMSRGALILLDDYCYLGHTEQGDAADRFAASKGAQILALPTGQGLLIR